MRSLCRSLVYRPILAPSDSDLWQETARRKRIVCRHASAEEGSSHSLEKLQRIVAKDPEVKESLERVRRAASLVADIQAQRAAVDEEERLARNASPSEVRSLEQRQAQRAAGRGANEDVLRAADELEQAKAAYTEAAAERDKWASSVDEELESIESAKAGAVAAIAATAANLPFAAATSLSNPVELLGSVAVVFLVGLLFGVTYRYAVRQDRNPQLKGGVIAAFGLARGTALAESALENNADRIFDVQTLATAGLLCGESVIAIAFAAAALETGFQHGFVKPFGSASSRESS